MTQMATSYQHVHFRLEDRVGRISFARPPLNVFNIEMMREITNAVTECGQRDVAAIVFDADKSCRAFSAGVAVEEHVQDTIFQMLDAFHSIFRQLEQIAKPAIALVDGAALGGGCELVAACDIVIASERARFGQPEIKLGVFPPVAAILLPLVIGEKRARELILTGEIIDALEAGRLGLCNHVVPSAHLEAKLLEVLAKLRELSGTSLSFARQALDLGRGRSIEAALNEQENIYLHELMKTEDANEGVKAFMEKRKAVWRHK
jgi:cyclohexa-1,5-dienecarbonyl-CoA hydratase